MRRSITRLLPAGLVLALLGAASAGAAPLPVLGYQEESGPLNRIDANAGAISVVGVDGVNLTSAGAGVSAPGPQARRQLARAHADGLKAELLIGNWDEEIEDFYEPTAFRLLGSQPDIEHVAATLAADAAGEGWDGISVDLEELAPRDAAGLVAFLQALRSDLPPQDLLDVNVSNYPKASQFAAHGYDLAGIGAAAGEVTLMAYDQHGPWEPHRPGPVGSLAWTKKGLAAMSAAIPAAKIDLGVAGYGYLWAPGHDEQVSDAQARTLVASAKGKATFKASIGEWTARLGPHSTLWWSDERSYRLKAALAQADGLHGTAVWSLGLSDPIPVL